MRALILVGGGMVLALACGSSGPADVPDQTGDTGTTNTAGRTQGMCEAVGEIQFICDVVSPEDLAAVPNTDWVIASGNREGGRIQLVNSRSKMARVLFPSSTSTQRLDSAMYPACPGPIDPQEADDFRAHGLYLKSGPDAIHTLYVVHHGFRESIEVFEFDSRTTSPTLTWVGCAVAPEALRFNSVVALPEGGFAATSGPTDDVWEWQTASGWASIPGSEDTAPNGLEISRDGQWLYIAGWSEEKVTRLSRGQTPIQKDIVQLGFRPDNLRMGSDGLIYATGHTDFQMPTEASNVAKIDPDTLEFEVIFHHPYIEGFAAATTAIPIGNDIWLGTNRGEMIAYFPAP